MMLEILEKDYTAIEEADEEIIGLTAGEAQRRLKINGLNRLAGKKKKSAMKIFANQFRDFMVMILLAATVISALLGEYYDALTIVIIVLINAVLGFIQEFKTEHTLEALEKMTSPTAKVLRNGQLTVIPAEKMVDGDVFEVEAGDRIPCDGYIISCQSFSCDEAILTGESADALKTSRQNQVEFESLNLPYMTYMGTVCVKGNARCLCTHTGKRTQMGKVSGMIEKIKDEPTPLQKKLSELGKILGLICLGVCVVVFLAGILRGEPPFEMLMTGITIAIAAIPEGLPATVTIALALAVRKMLRQNALVNKLHSVETLGCATVICTDKTGTITENKMTVCKVITPHNQFDVTGTGYQKYGEYHMDGEKISPQAFADLREIQKCFVMCNNASISDAPDESRNRRHKSIYSASGDPTESALLIAAAKAGIFSQDLNLVRIDEIPFDSASRIMTVTCRDREGRIISYTKGAADVVLKRCGFYQKDEEILPLTQNVRKQAVLKNEELAGSALRVLAFCKTVEEKTVFLGLCAMSDPLRAEVKKSIKACEKAHIRTVMITGDHKLTACSIAREAGILKEGYIAVTGDELSQMTDEQLEECIEKASVFARITPEHKLRIVKAFKNKGHIVAMTGDGVNDAPAVKEASIGVSMGITGTDVTKQAADVILLDDNFKTLTVAVEQGRTIYSNIRKFVRYLISCNIGEIVTMLGGMLMGLPVVLLPTQILFVNLATDGLPAIALGLEPPEKSVMTKPPRKTTDSFFSDGLLNRIIFRGLLIGLFTILSFVLGLKISSDLATARTCGFFTLILSQLIHVFECKSEDKSLLRINPLTNLWLVLAAGASMLCLLLVLYFPPLQIVFSTVALGTKQLLISSLCAFAVPIAACVFYRKK